MANEGEDTVSIQHGESGEVSGRCANWGTTHLVGSWQQTLGSSDVNRTSRIGGFCSEG